MAHFGTVYAPSFPYNKAARTGASNTRTDLTQQAQRRGQSC